MRFSPLPLIACAGALGLGALASLDAVPEPLEWGPGPVHLLPFGLMDEVRDPAYQVPMQVQAYHEGQGGVHLLALEVFGPGGQEVDRLDLQGERLEGDDGLLKGFHQMLERLNPDISHRHRQRLFLPLKDRPKLSPEQEGDLLQQVLKESERLRRQGGQQISNLKFSVDLNRLFPMDALPGDSVPLEIVLHYEDAQGQSQSVRYRHAVRLLPPFLGPPSGWQAGRGGGFWATGDLHVHNCRDQALLGCPNCAAESFNVTGAYTNADLKPQYQSLGFSFFSTTTHSYCINNDTEFQLIASEASSLDDPQFQVVLGTELTCRETGPQSGADINDAVCLLGGNFFTGINHMGGHFLQTRKPGGQEGFLDNCDSPLYDQSVNVSEVNAEGGFTIANHPGGDTISFNSVSWFRGLESGQAHGTEIWNGGQFNANFDHKKWWVDRLLEGKFTYPYSGSDTHDAAYNFGAVHTWVEGALSDQSLRDALKSGRHYLSNGPFLSGRLFDNGGRSLEMGQYVIVAASSVPPNYPVSYEVSYNIGTDTADIYVFRGTVGDASEVEVQVFQGLTGSGTVTAVTTVPTNGSSWYRAELSGAGGSLAAYTSPSFVVLQ
ncbi:MAG: hypothetical protein DWQ01_01380 [Planctomycetota bacterium]|nr:MAG: hypothetical protein DWQ01_01380 [Planctomycetota bacterium]